MLFVAVSLVVLLVIILQFYIYHVDVKQSHVKNRHMELYNRNMKIVSRINWIINEPTASWLFTPALYVILHKKALRSLYAVHELSRARILPKNQFSTIAAQMRMHASAADIHAESLIHNYNNEKQNQESYIWPADLHDQRLLYNMIQRLEKITHRLMAEAIAFDVTQAILNEEVYRLQMLDRWCQCHFAMQDGNHLVIKGNLIAALRRFKDARELSLEPSNQHYAHLFTMLEQDSNLHIERIESTMNGINKAKTQESDSDGLDRFWDQKKTAY